MRAREMSVSDGLLERATLLMVSLRRESIPMRVPAHLLIVGYQEASLLLYADPLFVDLPVCVELKEEAVLHCALAGSKMILDSFQKDLPQSSEKITLPH